MCLSQSYISVPKDVRLSSTHYLIIKISKKRELKNIAINHSADIDYKDFVKVYRKCTKKPYSFLTIDTMLPASDPLRFRKKISNLKKMIVTDQLKIIDNKIKTNQAQYDLDRLAAKTSALSSNDLRKYEYLTGEDLGHKPSAVEPAKFDYSPMGKMFNKRLTEKDKKEGLLKSVKNIGDENEELLEEIKNQAIKESGSKDSNTAKVKKFLIYDQNHNSYK